MGCHIFYGSGTISNYDQLDKFETLPAAFGGDDQKLPNAAHEPSGEPPNATLCSASDP